MADLHTFWAELDALPMDDTPLIAAETRPFVRCRTGKSSQQAAAKKAVHRAKKARPLAAVGQSDQRCRLRGGAVRG